MIKSLRLQNIRAFVDSRFDFDEGVNLIVGKNGSGKTSLLEGIAFFTFGRFESAGEDYSAVRYGNEIGRLELKVRGESEEILEAAVSRDEKTVKINTNKVPNSGIIGYIKTIFFNPETIDLVSGSPQVRRRELDMIISETDKSYVRVLLKYKNILKQRNNLLKRIERSLSKKDELEFWDEQMVEVGSLILKKREKLLKALNQNLSNSYQRLSSSREKLKIKYLPSCSYERFSESLEAAYPGDLKIGQTTIGPHRDDFFFANKAPLRDHASRGERRIAAISFKLETKRFLGGGKQVVAVLDDVFSELDSERREAISSAIEGSQTFISATDERILPDTIKKGAKIIKLE